MDNIKKDDVKENNGEFWYREWNKEESSERVRHLEGRGVEFQVKCGLELLRAKANIQHGDFLLFLKKSGFTTPDIPERRMKLAREYMYFVGFATSVKRLNPDETDVRVVMKIAYSENPQFADFDSWRKGEFNINTFLKPKNTVVKRGYLGTIFGFKPFEIFMVVNQAIDEKYPSWNLNEKTEAIDTLENIKRFCDEAIEHISTLEALSAREQMKNSREAKNLYKSINIVDNPIDNECHNNCQMALK